MAPLSVQEQLLLRKKVSVITGLIAALLGIACFLAAGLGYWIQPAMPVYNYIVGILFFVLSFSLLGGWEWVRHR